MKKLNTAENKEEEISEHQILMEDTTTDPMETMAAHR